MNDNEFLVEKIKVACPECGKENNCIRSIELRDGELFIPDRGCLCKYCNITFIYHSYICMGAYKK